MSRIEEAQRTEVVVGTRNFRHNPDVENFYRFVHENSLRHEAKMIIALVLDKVKKNMKKKDQKKKS